MAKTRAEAEAWLLEGEPVSGTLAWDRSPLDYATLPCGFRTYDITSQRNIEVFKAMPDYLGIVAIDEFFAACRLEKAEHAEHVAGQCEVLNSGR